MNALSCDTFASGEARNDVSPHLALALTPRRASRNSRRAPSWARSPGAKAPPTQPALFGAHGRAVPPRSNHHSCRRWVRFCFRLSSA